MRYRVSYRLRKFSLEESIEVEATSKWKAYDIAVFEKIPEVEGKHPYSAWVDCVIYKSGKQHDFNTCDGIPY